MCVAEKYGKSGNPGGEQTNNNNDNLEISSEMTTTNVN